MYFILPLVELWHNNILNFLHVSSLLVNGAGGEGCPLVDAMKFFFMDVSTMDF